MVSNHGDRKSLNGGNFPFQMGVLWLINRGDPNHLLNGMILQVGCPAGSDRNYFVSWVVSPTQGTKSTDFYRGSNLFTKSTSQ